MTLTLLLLRHAKSSWDTPGLDDFERPLAPRGIKAAPMMGAAIVRQKLVPALILCSTSVRTRETLALMLPQLAPARPEVVYEDALYLATTSDLLERIRCLPDTRRRVMLVGHNPGMHGAALALAGHGARKDVAALAIKFPTAALAVLSFPFAHWAAVRPASGTLTRFTTPRTLTADSER